MDDQPGHVKIERLGDAVWKKRLGPDFDTIEGSSDLYSLLTMARPEARIRVIMKIGERELWVGSDASRARTLHAFAEMARNDASQDVRRMAVLSMRYLYDRHDRKLGRQVIRWLCELALDHQCEAKMRVFAYLTTLNCMRFTEFAEAGDDPFPLLDETFTVSSINEARLLRLLALVNQT